MSVDASSELLEAPSEPTTWHSIRPWSTPLALSVKEITSVSATFLLHSDLDSDPDGDLDATLASLDDDHSDDTQQSPSDTISAIDQPARRSVVADALAKGVSVTCNGSSWTRVFIKMGGKADEAVIIIYGLMPGRQYDVTLGIVHAGQSSPLLQRQVVTTDEEPQEYNSNSADQSVPTSPTPPVPTLEDRLSQLQQNLSALNAEQSNLLTSLKTAKRDSQKADATLRSEIDVLKRASEKHMAAELRGKQKTLALQEAIKRAQMATIDNEERLKGIEESIPALDEQRAAKEKEHALVKAESDRARKERSIDDEKSKKRIDSMKTELQALTNKLERLNTKKEKLETSVIHDLEEQLKETEMEIIRCREVEMYGLDIDDLSEDQKQQYHGVLLTQQQQQNLAQVAAGYVPTQRSRNQLQQRSRGLIGRPTAPQPIQRSPYSDGARWNIPPRQMQLTNSHSYSHSHPSHSSSYLALAQQSQQHQSVIGNNLLRQSSLKSTTTHSSSPETSLHSSTPPNNNPPSTNSSSSSPSSLHTSAVTSSTAPISAVTLSSRAPAFEPGWAIKSSNSNSNTNTDPSPTTASPLLNSSSTSPGPTMVPIQRPSPQGLRSSSGSFSRVSGRGSGNGNVNVGSSQWGAYGGEQK